MIDRPRGMLFVTVVSAHNVPKMDWFNGSDPYVRYAAPEHSMQSVRLHVPDTAGGTLPERPFLPVQSKYRSSCSEWI